MLKVVFFMLFGIVPLNAQEVVKDTIAIQPETKNLKFKYKQLIIPTVLIGYGVVGLESHQLLYFNTELREEVNEHIDEKITIDDFSQYAPATTVYVLNATGIHGKNNFKKRTIIFATSYVIMSTSVLGLKSLSNIERPDGRSNNSFPSGHTATAFAGAEFLWQEYKDKSIWYGISGYVVATGTGLFRVYNNRHWLTDVAMGAGIGILSTKIAYWIYPYIDRKIFNSKESAATSLVAPFYNGRQVGLSFVKTF